MSRAPGRGGAGQGGSGGRPRRGRAAALYLGACLPRAWCSQLGAGSGRQRHSTACRRQLAPRRQPGVPLAPQRSPLYALYSSPLCTTLSVG
jgi:hypothetical protein